MKRFAQSTGRNLSVASSYLIAEGYRAHVEQRTAQVMNYVPPTETDDRKAVAYYLPATLINEVKRIAMSEHRSASAIVADMIRANLQARAEATKASA